MLHPRHQAHPRSSSPKCCLSQTEHSQQMASSSPFSEALSEAALSSDDEPILAELRGQQGFALDHIKVHVALFAWQSE
eukprot:1476940-Prymnesium_polylepis.1